MGKMTLETRQRVIYFSQMGMKLKAIKHPLEDEGIRVSKTIICLLLKKYEETGSVAD